MSTHGWWWWQWVGNYGEIFVTKTLLHTLDLSSWPFAPSPERRKGNILWTRSGKKRCFHFLGIGFVLWAIKVKVNTDFIQFFSEQEYTIYICENFFFRCFASFINNWWCSVGVTESRALQGNLYLVATLICTFHTHPVQSTLFCIIVKIK